MQERPITVTIRIRHGQTTLRLTHGRSEKVIARLGNVHGIHRLALVTLLEGLSLWFQTTLHVALIADSEQIEVDWIGRRPWLWTSHASLRSRAGPPPRPS